PTANAPDPANLTPTIPTTILNNAPRWSHPPGNQVVPSPWQATKADLKRIQDTLNQRPRPTLGLDTPAQRLAALLNHPASTTDVALNT
ncbi:hypothetical protein, partial [Mycobacterium attenuatum]|uniref:hypothetical protein n=1 Tax=Mycobacterium attenuatum TaxID=2341086 RepID=UPI0010A954DF